MEREQEVNIKIVESGVNLSTQMREFAARVPKVARYSAPLFLTIMAVVAACNNDGIVDSSKTPVDATPGVNMTALAGGDHVLDISDICRETKLGLKACFDVNQDGTVDDADAEMERNFVGTTPIYPKDLDGDNKITCEDLGMLETFVKEHKGEAVESDFEGIPIGELNSRILTSSIFIFVPAKTDESAIETILSSSTRYNLLNTDGRKNYDVINDPRGTSKIVEIKIPKDVVENPDFDIVQLHKGLDEASGVSAVSFIFAGLSPAITFGTPQNCP